MFLLPRLPRMKMENGCSSPSMKNSLRHKEVNIPLIVIGVLRVSNSTWVALALSLIKRALFSQARTR